MHIISKLGIHACKNLWDSQWRSDKEQRTIQKAVKQPIQLTPHYIRISTFQHTTFLLQMLEDHTFHLQYWRHALQRHLHLEPNCSNTVTSLVYMCQWGKCSRYVLFTKHSTNSISLLIIQPISNHQESDGICYQATLTLQCQIGFCSTNRQVSTQTWPNRQNPKVRSEWIILTPRQHLTMSSIKVKLKSLGIAKGTNSNSWSHSSHKNRQLWLVNDRLS